MRQALGGDAALAAVQSFAVSGSESHNIEGHVSSASIEWTAALPDRFVRVRRLVTPVGSDVMVAGFRGDARISRHDSDFPLPPDPSDGDPPDQRAAHDAVVVRNLKREFSRVAIALIGTPAIDSLDVSYEAQRTVGGRACDVLRLRASDGYTALLVVDTATHLPVMVSWMAAPVVTFTTSSTVVTTSQRGQPLSSVTMPQAPPPSFPTSVPNGRGPGTRSIPPLDAHVTQPEQTFPLGDSAVEPAAGPQMEYQIQFEDFKVVDGLKWPHRFTSKFGDLYVQTTRVRKYKLNPKIDPKVFDPARR